MARDRSFDIAKGLVMLLVVLGHENTTTPELLHNAIYAFHMPFFFFLAGYFFKEKPWQVAIKRDSLRLMVPYFIVVGIWCCTVLVDSIQQNNYRWFGAALVGMFYGSAHDTFFPHYGSIAMISIMWFLPAMFWARQGFNLLCRMKYCYGIILALSFFAILVYPIQSFPFTIGPAMISLVFMQVGYDIKRYGIDTMPMKKVRWGILALVAVWIFCSFKISIDIARCIFPTYIVSLMGALGGTVATIGACRWLDSHARYVPHLVGMLEFLGINSLIFLCLHFLGFIPRYPSTYLPLDSFLIWIWTSFWLGLSTWIVTKIPFLKKLFTLG